MVLKKSARLYGGGASIRTWRHRDALLERALEMRLIREAEVERDGRVRAAMPQQAARRVDAQIELIRVRRHARRGTKRADERIAAHARHLRELGDRSLVALVFPHDDAGDSFFEHVMRRRRSLDLMWPVKSAGQSVLLNLMPATDATGVDGYLARIESSLRAQFNLDLEGARIGVHTLHLGGDAPGPALKRLLARSGFDG